MTFEQKGVEKLDCFVNLRVSRAERMKLKEDADCASLSVSELVRRQYFNRPIVSKIDMKIINELRRIGGLVKTIHNESRGIYSLETSQVLKALRAKIDEIMIQSESKNDR